MYNSKQNFPCAVKFSSFVLGAEEKSISLPHLTLCAATSLRRNEYIIVTTKGGEREIPVDSVITSISYIPGTPLAEKNGKHISIIGDAGKVGNLKTAILTADDLAVVLSK